MRPPLFDAFVETPRAAPAVPLGLSTRGAPSDIQRSNNGVVETVARADLLWDDEARGLCVRVYGDDSKSFVFVYRIGDRQRFIRIGTSPPLSLQTARTRAKELRSILDKGRDPARESGGEVPPPVENLIQFIAENLATKA
jgi:hypothetical protein